MQHSGTKSISNDAKCLVLDRHVPLVVEAYSVWGMGYGNTGLFACNPANMSIVQSNLW